MRTSSQFQDGAQIKVYPHLAQRFYLWIGFKKPLSRPGAPFHTITETLMYNSTNFPRLTLIQYDKAFSLSATPVEWLNLELNIY